MRENLKITFEKHQLLLNVLFQLYFPMVCLVCKHVFTVMSKERVNKLSSNKNTRYTKCFTYISELSELLLINVPILVSIFCIKMCSAKLSDSKFASSSSTPDEFFLNLLNLG
jgi:hypothetical protein